MALQPQQALLDLGWQEEEEDEEEEGEEEIKTDEQLLNYASRKGNATKVNELLQKGVDPDSQSVTGGPSPLHHSRTTEIAQLLLNHGANIHHRGFNGDTVLHRKWLPDQDDLLQFLINRGAGVDADNELGRTPLHTATENDSGSAAQILLGNGANVASLDRFNRSALHRAAAYGSRKVASVLLRFGSDPNATDHHMDTPLHQATCFHLQHDDFDDEGNVDDGRALEVSQLLLAQGVNVDALNEFAMTPLIKAAAQNRSVHYLQFLLDHNAAVDAADKHGRTALVWAAMNGQHSSVQLLLERGADPNKVFDTGDTLLHHVSLGAEMAQRLLNGGASVDQCNRHGSTPLHVAATLGIIEVAELLLDRGAAVDTQDDQGDTPLHSAVSHFNADSAVQMIQLLLNKGAEVNKTNIQGETPLLCAFEEEGRAGNEYTQIVRVLLDRGADVHATDMQGQTSLHKAMSLYLSDTYVHHVDETGDWEVHTSEGTLKDTTHLLLEHGASVAAVDNDGKTPLHCAVTHGKKEQAQVLLDNGANIWAADNAGKTPLYYGAIISKDDKEKFWCARDMVRFLLNNGAGLQVGAGVKASGPQRKKRPSAEEPLARTEKKKAKTIE